MTMMNLNAPPPFLGGAAEGVSTSIAPEFEPEAEAEPGVEVADEAAATFAPHFIQKGEPVSAAPQAEHTLAAGAGAGAGSKLTGTSEAGARTDGAADSPAAALRTATGPRWCKNKRTA